MNSSFHASNRQRLYADMKPNSLLVMFSGEEIRKTNDEYYPFFADRSFVYLTGIQQKEAVLVYNFCFFNIYCGYTYNSRKTD